MTETRAPVRRFVAFEEALETILVQARGLRLTTETIPLDDALGRTLREEIVADEPFPPFSNSAMDGFAVHSLDVASASAISPIRLRVLERIAAGQVPTNPIRRGEAVRIMTGALLPQGADAVVPIEVTSARRIEKSEPGGGAGMRLFGDGTEVEIFQAARSGENIRAAGEDFRQGTRLIEPGVLVDPGVVAVMTALGHNSAEVSRLPRVAILSTGDELVAPGQPLTPGKIRDSNSHTLRALVRAAGAEPGPTWHVADEPDAVETAVRQVIDRVEVVLTIGGVSAGDFDPVRESVGSLPDVELWKVGMRPGQPQAFGTIGGRLFFGLPGNPVSSAVVFEMLVRPALWTMLGRKALDRPRVLAMMAETVTSKTDRRDFLRVQIDTLDPAEAVTAGVAHRARLTGTQSSGAVSSILKSDGLAVIPDDVELVEAGEVVEVLLWKTPPTGEIERS